ncbi:MAG: aminotransferase DegT [Bacteroidetes bacterium GWE2_29_8]|nr:MAG: aminotransferase DegT [Bacteroidetes bacterium GWE2_29_8]OFY15374.1 MAG: aminotransferase DegT [Bacteroidetes bacterium GWF2_29_10]
MKRKYDFIPVSEPVLDGNEKKYVLDCIDSGWISSEGPYVEKFESQMCQITGRKYAVALSNGTVALELAVRALKIGEGDEVIIPSFTIISCAMAVLKNGAKPVLVDSDINTWNVDTEKIESKITKRTKAIMVVHIYGLPVNMDKIISLCKKYNLLLIEDAAEMHGQTYKNKPCGSFGNISVFSFYPNKHITTGEGGMVLTDDLELADYCKSLRNLCFNNKQRFIHEELGYNFRMSNIQAALGLAQAEKLENTINIKREIGKKYTELLKSNNALILSPNNVDYAKNIYWVYGIIIDNKVIDYKAKLICERLAQFGIATRPFFFGMHLQPVFQKMQLFNNEKYPISDQMSNYGFYIPSSINLEDEKIEYIVNVVNEVTLL